MGSLQQFSDLDRQIFRINVTEVDDDEGEVRGFSFSICKMVMGYRVLTWLTAYVNLVICGILEVSLVGFGYILVPLSFSTPVFPTELLGQWFFLVVFGAILNTLKILGCRKLTQATETSGKPDIALKLTDLWWIVSVISYAVLIPIAFTETFIKTGFFYYIPANVEDLPFDPVTLMHVIHVIIFPLNTFMLFCVYQFRQELKTSISHSTSHAMTPLNPSGEHNGSKNHHSSP